MEQTVECLFGLLFIAIFQIRSAEVEEGFIVAGGCGKKRQRFLQPLDGGRILAGAEVEPANIDFVLQLLGSTRLQFAPHVGRIFRGRVLPQKAFEHGNGVFHRGLFGIDTADLVEVTEAEPVQGIGGFFVGGMELTKVFVGRSGLDVILVCELGIRNFQLGEGGKIRCGIRLLHFFPLVDGVLIMIGCEQPVAVLDERFRGRGGGRRCRRCAAGDETEEAGADEGSKQHQ